MLSDEELDAVKQWSENTERLSNDILKEQPTIYREMSEGLLKVISDFQNQSVLIPVGREEFLGMEDLYTQIQLQFKGGEDLLKD